jgi:hypothetical protein
MTPIDREESDPNGSRQFERLLLDSARADELPRDIAGAWARFGASLASVGEFAARGAAAGGGRDAAAYNAGGGVRGARMLAAKWLLVGLCAGSALTVLGLSRVRGWRQIQPTRALTAANVASVASVASTAPAVSASAAPVAVAAAPDSGARSQQSSPVPRFSARSERSTAASRSTLGAQVALLDAARAAVAAGAFGEALRATARYQREFPQGELLPDAEVVAIEALAASGARGALGERARRFLARYPDDPHAARVKALAVPR